MADYPFKEVDMAFNIFGFHTAIEYNWDEHYSVCGERHDFWEIVYVISGEVEVVEDDRVYRLKERNIIFHAPMEFHKIRSLPGMSPHILILTFSAAGTLPAELKEGVFNVSLEEQEILYSIVGVVSDFLEGRGSDMLEMNLTVLGLSSFLLKLISSQKAKSRYSHLRSATEYHNIVTTMKNELYSNITLAELSDKCNVSISYIKLLFARYSGISPKAYYSNMRFDEAVRLLEEEYSVNEVSEMMNFSSRNYFSVFFKSRCGLPPAKYIKQAR